MHNGFSRAISEPVTFSFINYMQMIQDCRVVTISTNQIITSAIVQFAVTASRGF